MLGPGIGRAHNIALSTLPNRCPAALQPAGATGPDITKAQSHRVTTRHNRCAGCAGIGYEPRRSRIDADVRREELTSSVPTIPLNGPALFCPSVMALVVIIWSINYTVAKIGYRAVPPLSLAAFRTRRGWRCCR
jgi:hypothetical protein